MSNWLASALGRFRWVAIAEGWSFLILLFAAMPLKYFFNYPLAVKYVGWAHGVLFLGYLITLINVWISDKWSFFKVVLAFVVSLIPFGTFWFDKKHLQ